MAVTRSARMVHFWFYVAGVKMLYTYPSNKLENLVLVLDQLLKVPHEHTLQPDTILVQHPGMQHWLSMSLANLPERQLCMNAEYPLPVRYFWDLIRTILGPDVVPDRSVYSREILAWRIYKLLGSDLTINEPMMSEPTRYWQKQHFSAQDNRRFQLSEQIADVFEQYLMFRPDWIEQWEAGETPHWQAYLWQQLVAQNPNHPLRLMKAASAKIEQPVGSLPSHFYLFGINALAPIWLEFLTDIADKAKVDIHLLYLNPSDDYWDGLVSEKQQAKARAKWINTESTTEAPQHSEVGNPLLSSLGRQGQTFVRMLSEKAQIDVPAFSEPTCENFLGHLQRDILTLEDARNAPKPECVDDSITIASGHSALREVQGLHDWLLHQFNNDPELTPKDVLVMCPNVEDYAPFVQAVFARSFAHLDDSVPPLPCSIADRNLKDADPTVAAFLQLLQLPDARFEVNQLMSWLRVPAIADKFELNPNDITIIQQWLEHAHIHWGLNAEHKEQWVNGDQTDHFTWKQGLDRLLLGFAYADEITYVNDTVLLPHVEGEQALLLGRLVHIIEQLQSARSELVKARTPSQWQHYLLEQLQIALLSSDDAFARSNYYILSAVNDFTEFANKANLDQELIPLSVVRNVLENAFASAEQTGSQFMTGQITVCSMVPMRSIPFKVVAILGLNDGEFPRTRPPMGFDLMAQTPPRLGDRSRRGDDRYLFLEALLSARQSLYLSYQGFDINKNEPLPPSLVLDELLDYLQKGYEFQPSNIHQLPLQPYHWRNYQGRFASFDPNWIALVNQSQSHNDNTPLPEADLKKEWELSEWIRFFTHPAKYFCEQRLGLYLQQYNNDALEDNEPFSLTHLDRYSIQAHTIAKAIKGSDDESPSIYQVKLASSELPTHSLVPQEIEHWQAQAITFAQRLQNLKAHTVEETFITMELGNITVSASLPITEDKQLLFWRLANCKGKDIATLWLHHLLANCITPTTSTGVYRGPKETYEVIECAALPNPPKALLAALFEFIKLGQQQALFINADLALMLCRDKFNEKSYKDSWQHSFNDQGFAFDPYIAHFWKECPNFQDTEQQLNDVYSELIKITSMNLESAEPTTSEEL
ncbi:exodeoxyribonuclease V subunit gamma [Reinekea marina]|nr:exodeoxyribonuclease V subunit gamma [Reinekea marina]MDN3648196.1 exodeoxyribonuclease V subunit gamma [Reinekea marina]